MPKQSDATFNSFDGRCTLTRGQVAELLNDGVQDAEITDYDDVEQFSADDDRLTDEVCVSFACNMADFEDYLEATENVLSEFPEIRVR